MSTTEKINKYFKKLLILNFQKANNTASESASSTTTATTITVQTAKEATPSLEHALLLKFARATI